MITNERIVKIMSRINCTKGNKMPISIQAAINDGCFNDCIMCDHPQKPKKYTVDGSDWADFIYECRKYGLESVCYTGGDPFAHKDINEIMLAHVQHNIRFGFITSGYIPKKVDMRLLKYADWIRVSLDAIKPESYKRVRGLIGVDKVLDGIDTMLEYGIEVGLCPTVHFYNRDDIFDVLDYALDKGIYVAVKTAYPGTICLDGIDWDRIKSYRKVFDEADIELRVYDGMDYESFEKCSAVFYQLFIDSKGDVYPCCTLGGDVTLEPGISGLCNIKDGIDKIIEVRNNFATLGWDDRPDGCKNCMGRFTEINHVVELATKPTVRSFF